MNPNHYLRFSTTAWFLVTLIGQWFFAAYIALYHGTLLLQKGLLGMGETHMPNGYIEGDNFGNTLLAIHLITATVIIAGGPLQLIPQIRNSFPKFHRYLGRLYLAFVFFGASGGLYLIWTRPMPSFGNIYQNIAISIEALLIITFSILALKYAIARKIPMHQKWALRLFIVASGVWFLRIGYMAWYFFEGLSGVQFEYFFDIWSYGSFIVPLAILELYFLTIRKKQSSLTTITASVLIIVSIIMGIGISIAAIHMWLPRIIELM